MTPERKISTSQNLQEQVAPQQEVELTPPQRARQLVIDYGENSQLDSIPFEAFEDRINLIWAVAYPQKFRRNITGLRISKKRGYYDLMSLIGNMIQEKMSENAEYKSASEHVDNLINNYILTSRLQSINKVGYLPDSYSLRKIYDRCAADLMKVKNKIKKNKIQQPQTPPEK